MPLSGPKFPARTFLYLSFCSFTQELGGIVFVLYSSFRSKKNPRKIGYNLPPKSNLSKANPPLPPPRRAANHLCICERSRAHHYQSGGSVTPLIEPQGSKAQSKATLRHSPAAIWRVLDREETIKCRKSFRVLFFFVLHNRRERQWHNQLFLLIPVSLHVFWVGLFKASWAWKAKEKGRGGKTCLMIP